MPETPEPIAAHEAAEQLSTWQRHRFLLMVFGAIGISLILVTIAMSLYINSTAIELDLSRPAYQSVREQAGKDIPSTTFSSTGALDAAALKEFRDMYTSQYDKVVGASSFGSHALSDQALELPAIQD